MPAWRSVVGVVALVAFTAGCGSDSPPTAPSPTAPSPATTPTRIIALSGNMAFGNIQVGSNFPATLRISNSGNSALSITGMTITGGLSAVLTSSFTSGTILAGAFQEATIRFSPTAPQTYTGTLAVNGDQTSGTNTIAVSGTGTALPNTPAPNPTPTLATLTGTATEQGAGALSGANIEIRDGPDTKKTTTTDVSGRYTLSGLQLGSVTVRAWKSGYRDTDQRITLVAGSANTLNFSVPKTSTARERVGATCNDGTSSSATGSGACSSHGGVLCWRYNDGSCTNP